MINKIYPQQPDPYITTAPNQGIVKFGHLNRLVDAINTQQSQCCTYVVLAQKTLNFNTTADQTITFAVTGTKFLIKETIILNSSILTGFGTADIGQIYTGVSQSGSGGPIYVLGDIPSNVAFQSTLNPIKSAGKSVTITTNTLYFSLATPEGVLCTADILIYGTKLA